MAAVFRVCGYQVICMTYAADCSTTGDPVTPVWLHVMS
jgi:hypothetical protein